MERIIDDSKTADDVDWNAPGKQGGGRRLSPKNGSLSRRNQKDIELKDGRVVKSDVRQTPLKLGGTDAVDEQKIVPKKDNITDLMEICSRRIAPLERNIDTRHFEVK